MSLDGWTVDESGALRRVTKPHMGRRRAGFDYSQRRIYEITIVLEDRRPYLGRLVKLSREFAAARDGVAAAARDGVAAAARDGEWAIEPTAMGEAVMDCWRKIPEIWPQVSLIEAQLMPEHFHGVLFVKERLPLMYPDRPEGPGNRRRNLGDIIQGFKAGCTIAWRKLGGDIPHWAAGFVDSILFGRNQLATMIAYLRDNPRRLGVKREKPWLFKVARDIEVDFTRFRPGEGIEPWKGAQKGHFSAIGNHFLLDCPRLVQVQCSRRFFAYRRETAAARDGSRKQRISRNEKGEPIVELATEEFTAKLEAALTAAKHGAVIVSPCISDGEREIARLAFEAGYRVITLQNKGFSPLYKPGGRLFETCAKGNLLMLAPIAWPYQPAEKRMTRDDALVLNRIAQLIAGEGAERIDYKGAVMRGVDESAGGSVATSQLTLA